jgi:predicted HAD superfamily Cof-like phosphohydrolase
VYVIFHLCRTMGLPFEKGFAEVHRSNMTKVVDGKVLRREDGKIMKPPGYTPPNLINLIFDAYDLHAHQDLVLGSDNYRNKNC